MAYSLFHEALATLFSALAGVPDLVRRERIWSKRAIMEALLMLVGGRASKSAAGVLKALAERGVMAVDDIDDIPSRSGFCQARERLPADSIMSVFRATSGLVRERLGAGRKIFGLIGVAFDGTHIITPRDPSTVELFGRPKGGTVGGRHHYPQALMVMASEIGTRLPIAAELLPWDGSEHAGARAILACLGKDTIALFDRGFVGKKLLGEIVSTGSHLVLRMTTSDANSWDCIYRFLRSKAKATTVTLDVPKPGGGTMEITVRLLRRSFRVGRPRQGQKAETMVLLTTILDPAIASHDELVELYEQRWSIETSFRELKTVLNLERFHARKAERIRQEIAAALLWMTLVAAVEHEVDRVMASVRGPQRWNDPNRWQINRTLLYELLDDIAGAILRQDVDAPALDRLITRAARYLVRTAQRRRPGRSFPRKRLAPHGRFRNGG